MESDTKSPVIPVLDLMIGQIVLAQGGDRGNYLPVQSRLTHSSQPLDVAKALFSQTGCDELYLADIDSFAGANPNWSIYNQLLDHGFGLLVDADWVSQRKFENVIEKVINPERLKVILSSETIATATDFEVLAELIELKLNPVFSLDLKSDRVITRPGELEEAEAADLIALAYEHGVQSFIVLDLSSVGTLKGIDSSENELGKCLQNIRRTFPDVNLISGGGVREPEDISKLIDMGCQQVLVASAIHHCKITPFDIAEIGMREIDI